MRRPRIGLALGIIAFGLAACDNRGGPGGTTGGAAGPSSSAGGATSAGGSTGTAGTTSAGGATNTAGTTSAGGGAIGTGGSTSASGGASSTSDTTGTAGSTSTGGMTSASGGATGGTTDVSSSTAGATGGMGSTGSRADASPDTGVGTGGLPDAGRDASTARDLPGDTSFRPDSTVDRASDAIASNCTCLGKPAPMCTPTGHLTYTLSRAASPTADQSDAYNQITCAVDMAVAYYNCYANITGSVRVSYDTGVSTADGNINGSIRFGAGRQYMLCATAMHEIAHTQGIGTAPQWPSLVSNGQFTGANANAQLKAINATLTKPLYTVVNADTMHFWPYGLNYETEATGTDILVDHCQMVVAIRKDLGLQP